MLSANALKAHCRRLAAGFSCSCDEEAHLVVSPDAEFVVGAGSTRFCACRGSGCIMLACLSILAGLRMLGVLCARL